MSAHVNCFLFKHSSLEWRLLLEREAKVYEVRKGTTVFRAGETALGYYFLHEGCVKVHKKWKNNRDLILRFAKPGDILGHRGMPDTSHPVTATAMTDVTICFISASMFKSTMLINPVLAYEMTVLFARELHEVEQNMRNLVQWNVEQRIANALCNIVSAFGTDSQGALLLQLSRQDIASYAGTTYESVFKTLNEWKLEGLVRLLDKKIYIPEIERLKAIFDDIP